MNTPEIDFRRIAVALDASPDSRAAAVVAAELAVRLRAELEGVFVEDINLLDSAKLSVARHVGMFSSSATVPSNRQLECQLKAQADRARQCLSEAARRVGAQWTFRVTRGQVSTEVVTTGADLTILGRVGRFAAVDRRVGGTAQAVVSRDKGMTLVLCNGMEWVQAVTVFYDETEPAQKALVVAAKLARGMDSALQALVIAGDAGIDAGLRWATVKDGLRRQGLQVEEQTVSGVTSEALVAALSAPGRGIVVLPGVTALLDEETVQQVLGQSANPVLIVR